MHDDDVVAKNLAQNFGHLCGFGLAPNITAELSLHHPEAGLDVRTFVIMGVKFITMILIEVNRFFRQAATPPRMIAFVRDKSVLSQIWLTDPPGLPLAAAISVASV
jgi:hypothetical protein